MHMFGVCDGHGSSGRDVSNFVKYALHMQIQQRFPKEGQETFETIRKGLIDAFYATQSSLITQIQSTQYSGTTACILIIHGHKLITANAGNSRVISVTKHRNVRTLTQEHIPSRRSEKLRIEGSGGRISDAGRVLASDRDMVGLPLTRSLGDTVAHQVGVASEPEIKHFVLEEDEEILILASDGIWQYMTAQNVAQIAQAHYESGQAEAAANAIIRRATQLWKDE